MAAFRGVARAVLFDTREYFEPRKVSSGMTSFIKIIGRALPFHSTMCVADELCEELFRWFKQLDRCADYLIDLAEELEEMRKAFTTGQLVANTTSVLGSLTLVGTGVVTLMTGGLAAPLMVAAGAGTIAATAGAAASLTLKLLENWKSSEKMKDAERAIKKTAKIKENIDRLHRKLIEECEAQGLKASSSDEVQCEITVRLLTAMAKRSGRDLPLNLMRNHFRNGLLFGFPKGFAFSDTVFLQHFSVLMLLLGFQHCIVSAVKGSVGLGVIFNPKLIKEIFSELGLLVKISAKTLLKAAGKIAGGVFGLLLAIPELIENCEELIKNKHETEASKLLRNKAREIYAVLKEFRKHLNEIQEILKEVPDIECHISLAKEMLGSKVYTRGIVCREYKQIRKKDKRSWKQSYIMLSTKDMGTTQSAPIRKRKTNTRKDKRQRSTSATSTGLSTATFTSLQNRNRTAQRRETPQRSRTTQQRVQYRLPKITMTNVRSLSNKTEELLDMVENVDDFGNSDLMFFTETWWTRDSQHVDLRGFQAYRVDRVAKQSMKSRGGGLAMFVNEEWATDVEVEDIVITRDYEIMVVSIVPHDHPVDAPPLTFIHVYVPGPNFDLAANEIANLYFEALDKYDGGPIFILGDFNKCKLSSVLPHLEQYVTCPTRINNILDRCYGNIPGAYRCRCRLPLGRADHNVIHLIPKQPKSDKNDPSDDDECSHGYTQPR